MSLTVKQLKELLENIPDEIAEEMSVMVDNDKSNKDSVEVVTEGVELVTEADIYRVSFDTVLNKKLAMDSVLLLKWR